MTPTHEAADGAPRGSSDSAERPRLHEPGAERAGAAPSLDRGVRPATVLAGVLALVAAAYAPSLDGPFLWDDLQLVAQPMTEELHPLWEYFLTPFWDLRSETAGSGMFYRPLTILSLAVDRAAHGENAVGFHLTNVLLHLANSALVFALARRGGAGARGAGVAALLWALAPRLSESVAWISGRTDMLSALFGLSAVLAWSPRHERRRALAVALALAALFAKEAGLAAVAAISVAELTAWADTHRREARGSLGTATLLACALASYFALRSHALPGGVVATEHGISLGLVERGLTVLEASGRYASMIAIPWFPQTQIGVVGVPSLGYAALGAVALFACARWLPPIVRRSSAEERALLTLGVISLALVLHVVPLAWSATVGDRLLYLPLAVIAVTGSRWLEASLAGGWRPAVAVGVAVISFVPPLERRVALFGDEVAFWVDAVETTAPQTCGPESALIGLLQRARMCDEADEVITLTEARAPFVHACGFETLRAHCEAWRGDYPGARATYLRAASRGAGPLAATFLDLARSELRLGDRSEARRLQAEALRVSPGFTDAHALGRVLDEVDRLSALERRTPAQAAELEALHGRRAEAERAWLAALSAGPLEPETEGRGLAFLFRYASKEGAVAGAELARRGRGEDSPLLPALEQRLSVAEQLAAAMPRMRVVLGEKRALTGR